MLFTVLIQIQIYLLKLGYKLHCVVLQLMKTYHFIIVIMIIYSSLFHHYYGQAYDVGYDVQYYVYKWLQWFLLRLTGLKKDKVTFKCYFYLLFVLFVYLCVIYVRYFVPIRPMTIHCTSLSNVLSVTFYIVCTYIYNV